MPAGFSFIIPIHNAEDYLDACLDSIKDDALSLSAENYVQVILVENGSTDNTAARADRWIRNNSVEKRIDISLVYSEKGVSCARNKGIELSKGSHLIFVDSDDMWIKGSLAQISKDIEEKGADLYVYGFAKGRRDQSVPDCKNIVHKPSFKRLAGDAETLEQCKAWLISRPTYRMQAWGKVFDSAIVKSKALKYTETLTYSEDSEFVLRYLQECGTVYISDKAVYRYIINPDSAMCRRSKETGARRLNSYVASMVASREVMRGQSGEAMAAFWEYVLSHLNIILVHDVFDCLGALSWRERNRLLRELVEMKIFAEALENISYRRCLTYSLLPELCIKCRLYVLCGVLSCGKSYLNHVS